MSKCVLIDGDSLCYLGNNEDSVQQLMEKVDNKIQAIIEFSEATHYAIFVSKGRYFRHSISKTVGKEESYKANRVYNKDSHDKLLKEYLIYKYKANYQDGVEADDLIKYYMSSNLHDTLVLAAIDKDLLNSIPGKHINYNKKTSENTWEIVEVETSEEDANLFICKQMIIGDASDGIAGIAGKGPAYWNKLREFYKEKLTLPVILNEYIKHYGEAQGIFEFQKNYRLLHMLDCSQDFKREVGTLPIVPIINVVYKEETKLPEEF